MATTADDKKLKVWRVAETLELLSERYNYLLRLALRGRSPSLGRQGAPKETYRTQLYPRRADNHRQRQVRRRFQVSRSPYTPALISSIQRGRSYPLYPEPVSESSEPAPGASKRGSLTAHENPSNGTLVLGHASLLTTFLLTSDEQYIITADRDEHIRVSWYPQGYNVEQYCLGHEKYVPFSFLLSFHASLDDALR